MNKLQKYYEQLPGMTCPKTDFLNDVVRRCNVSFVAVRNWVKGKNKPADSKWVKELSEMTGIPENELFDED